MKRRDFIKVSGAAILASQLPNVDEAKATPKEYWNLSDEWPFDDLDKLSFAPGDYVGYGAPKVHRRRVIFLAEHDPDEVASVILLGPPPIGTAVAGEAKDGTLRVYTVVENLDGEVIPTVMSHWTQHHDNAKVGTTYFGYVAIVEGIAPAFGDQHGTIRRILTPNTGFYSVCENWRVERYGGDPNHPVLALDAFDPELCEQAVKAGLMPVWRSPK